MDRTAHLKEAPPNLASLLKMKLQCCHVVLIPTPIYNMAREYRLCQRGPALLSLLAVSVRRPAKFSVQILFSNNTFDFSSSVVTQPKATDRKIKTIN